LSPALSASYNYATTDTHTMANTPKGEGLDEESGVATRNKEFLDTYLEVGIGHYYTIAKILSGRVSGELPETERLSIGLEISAQASASFDNLVTWYHSLLRWDPRGEDTALPDILEAIEVEDSLRLEAFAVRQESQG